MEGVRKAIHHARGYAHNFLHPERRRTKSTTPASINNMLLQIVQEGSSTERVRTYANVLREISPEEVTHARNIAEVGMNDTLFKFRSVFQNQVHFYGITMTPSHAVAAQTEAQQLNIPATIAVGDIQNGFPQDWPQMDLAFDIYSASHYLDVDTTAKALGNILRPNGYIALAIGDDFVATADYVRTKLLTTREPLKTDPPVFVYRTNEPQSADVYPDQENEDPRVTVIKRMQMLKYPGISMATTETELFAELANIANIVGESLITDFDVSYASRYKLLLLAGFENIKKFYTADGGIGFIAQKKTPEISHV